MEKSQKDLTSNKNETKKLNYERHCHIVKRPDFDGYGFNLHSEKIKPGQYVGKVDPGSPAEAAGLREGDQIIEVNGSSIGTETHKQVVQRIKAISNEVRLLLIDPNTECDPSTNNKNHTIISEDNAVIGDPNNVSNVNSKPVSTVPTNLPNLMTTMAANATDALADEKEYITSISMVSTKSQSTNSNNPTVDVTDFDANEVNGLNSKVNGQSLDTALKHIPESVITDQTNLKHSESKTSENFQSNANNKTELNLNLTAAEMRAKLLAKKKFDPKNDTVDLKKKFDIIQKL